MKWVGLVTRPGLLWEALRTAWAFRVRGGVRPAPDLIAWRLHTAYGTPGARIETEDLLSFLAWRRDVRRFAGRRVP